MVRGLRESLSLPAFFKSLTELRERRGLKTTLLGIGPMSERIVRVSLQAAKSRDFPVMFIASRNQVDLKDLGGGYVSSWDQRSFVETIREMARELQFTGLYYVCRDHGGPWQRDSEQLKKLSAEKAMNIAKRSYLEDLLQGFDMLHIDPTKDPHAAEGIDLETVVKRTVTLIEYIEKQRKTRGLPEVAFEVGTEETSGGLTDPETFEWYIKNINSILTRKDLPHPMFIVGQTGTLVRMTKNVGSFNARAAQTLSRLALRHDTGLKEHNADYLDDATLFLHPVLGITAANVAPEFGWAETDSYLELGRVEEEARNANYLSSSSNIIDTISKKAVWSERWRKWMVGTTHEMAVEEVEKDHQLRMQIARICGHYVFDDPEVVDSIKQLKRNLANLGLDADHFVDDRVARSIGRYVTCFNLDNLTSTILTQNGLQ